MKKWMIALSGLCLVGLVFFITNEKVTTGTGTFDDPYKTKDTKIIDHIETIFKDAYPTMFIDSTEMYNTYTDASWTNQTTTKEQIHIDYIQYYGHNHMADYLVVWAGGGFPKSLNQEVSRRFKDETIVITTSSHCLTFNFDIENLTESLNMNQRNDDFAKKIADMYLENEKASMMIVDYKVNYNHAWYQASSLIDINNPNYLQIPNEVYGMGELTIKREN